MKKVAKWIKSWEWPDEVTDEVEKLLNPVKPSTSVQEPIG